MADILVVDDEVGIRELLSEILRDEGHDVKLAGNARAARLMRDEARPDLVLLDIWMPDTDGITLLKEWARTGLLTMPVVMMSGHGTIDTAVEATRLGAFDFLEKPIALQKLLATVTRALRRGEAAAAPDLSLDVLGRAPAIGELRRRLDQLRPLRTPVVLIAEPGVRADLCARYLHVAPAPWAELREPARLAEAPLELAGGARDGTLYVPDLAALGRTEQKGLLLLVNRPERHNARVIACTVRDPAEMAAAGALDAQLYRTLAPALLRVPALREHREDVPLLANLLLTRLIESKETPPRAFDTAALNALRHYSWPGNLTQLEQVVRSLALTATGAEIGAADVTAVLALDAVPLAAPAGPAAPPVATAPARFDFGQPLREARDAFERAYLEHHIAHEGGNMSRVAERVGLERTHLYRKLKQLGVRIGRRGDDPRADE
jgi:DNA-binding NtrC family response regulator